MVGICSCGHFFTNISNHTLRLFAYINKWFWRVLTPLYNTYITSHHGWLEGHHIILWWQMTQPWFYWCISGHITHTWDRASYKSLFLTSGDHMCAGEPPIMNFGALFACLGLCPLMKEGDHVKPSPRASINHSFMSPHLNTLYRGQGATYLEF